MQTSKALASVHQDVWAQISLQMPDRPREHTCEQVWDRGGLLWRAAGEQVCRQVKADFKAEAGTS